MNKKIILHAPNKTAASGMEYLGLSALNWSVHPLLLLETPFLVDNKLPFIILNDSIKPSFLGTLLKKSIRVLELFIRRPLVLLFALFNLDDLRTLLFIDKMSQNKIRIKRIFDDFQPDAVYVYGDRHDGYEPALIQVANKMGIPVIIPPIAYGSDKEGLLKYKRREFQVLNTHDVTNLHSIKSQFHYQWRYDYVSRRDISYYPPLSLSVRAECNILPHNPWTLGGGYSDKVCVSGEFEFQRFILNECHHTKFQ